MCSGSTFGLPECSLLSRYAKDATMYVLFVDVSNIYFNVREKFEKGRLNYRLYVEFLEQRLGYQLGQKIAYGVQSYQAANTFITMLRNLGFQTDFAEHNPTDVAMSVTCMSMLKNLSTVVIGSNKVTMIPLINRLKVNGIRVIVCASAIPRELKAITECIEIIPELLAPELQPSDIINEQDQLGTTTQSLDMSSDGVQLGV